MPVHPDMGSQPSALVNIVMFQLGWFACVLGAAHGTPWLGPVATALAVFVHLFIAPRVLPELQLLMASLFVGLLWETLVLQLGLVRFEAGGSMSRWAPLWIIAMWPLFATTLNCSLGFLHGRYLLAAALGAVGGPLAYYAGQQLGALTLTPTTSALLVQGAGWALLMPLLMLLARRFAGVRQRV